MKALLKRSGALDQALPSFHHENLNLDMAAHQLTLQGLPVALTPKEYDLLVFFTSRPHQVFTRDQLLNQVWGYDYFGDARTVDTHIRSLREKLGEYRSLIATVWGTGYRFETGGKP
jgi:two-component system response regulator ResD